MNSKDLLLMPKPKKIAVREGGLKLPAHGYIVLKGEEPGRLLVGAEKLAKALKGDWKVTASPTGAKTPSPIVLECDPAAPRGPEGYKLTVKASGINITAASPAGVYYGVCTLAQLLKGNAKVLPLVTVEDWPDFAARGVMLDVSRDKVPTLETLMELIDLLSEWKINQFQLYTEHTFEYIGHEVVWNKASPVTGEDVLKLDAYCAERFVELVPNQNSFGHLARWLVNKEYRALAEIPESPNSLDPRDPGSVKLLADMYDQLLPHFSSRNLNVGCDETHDLGRGKSKEICEKVGVGRVYLDFLLELHKLASERGRKMQFWGDIILHHPELIPELPKDLIALEWGYGSAHAFKENGEKFAASGIEFWVCPGTSSWNSLVGVTTNAIGNLENAAKNGLAKGATGYLNTDWGDGGHWQFLPVSYLGYLYGAACSWNATGTDAKALPDALSAFAFNDSAHVMGQVAYDLGDAYMKVGKKVGNSNIQCRLFNSGYPTPDQLIEGLSAEELDAAIEAMRDAVKRMKASKMDRPDAELIKSEFACNAALAEIGCLIGKLRLAADAGASISRERKAVAARLAKTIEGFSCLWLERNRPGGLADSVRRLERVLKSLEG